MNVCHTMHPNRTPHGNALNVINPMLDRTGACVEGERLAGELALQRFKGAGQLGVNGVRMAELLDRVLQSALHVGQPLLQGSAAVNQRVLQSALHPGQPLPQDGAAVNQRAQERSPGVPLCSQGVVETGFSLAMLLNRILQRALKRIESQLECLNRVHRGARGGRPAELRQEL